MALLIFPNIWLAGGHGLTQSFKEQYLKIFGLKSSHPCDLDGSKVNNISKTSALFISMLVSWFDGVGRSFIGGRQ